MIPHASVCCFPQVRCPSTLATQDLEAEIFLHMMQMYAESTAKASKEEADALVNAYAVNSDGMAPPRCVFWLLSPANSFCRQQQSRAATDWNVPLCMLRCACVCRSTQFRGSECSRRQFGGRGWAQALEQLAAPLKLGSSELVPLLAKFGSAMGLSSGKTRIVAGPNEQGIWMWCREGTKLWCNDECVTPVACSAERDPTEAGRGVAAVARAVRGSLLCGMPRRGFVRHPAGGTACELLAKHRASVQRAVFDLSAARQILGPCPGIHGGIAHCCGCLFPPRLDRVNPCCRRRSRG